MSTYFWRVYDIWNHSETAFGHRKVFESLEAVASEAEEQKQSGRDFHIDPDCRKVTELIRNSRKHSLHNTIDENESTGGDTMGPYVFKSRN